MGSFQLAGVGSGCAVLLQLDNLDAGGGKGDLVGRRVYREKLRQPSTWKPMMEVRVRSCCCSLETSVVIVGILQVSKGLVWKRHPFGKMPLVIGQSFGISFTCFFCVPAVIEFGLKMIQFKIQFKTNSKISIQKNIHSKQNPK